MIINLQILLYTFLFVLNLSFCQESDFEIKCREQNRLIGSDKSDYYELIEAQIGQKVILACHYCQENENAKSHRIWYKQDSLSATNLTSFSSAREVDLGMAANASRNRISTDMNHNLVILEIRDEDVGLYFCHGPLGEATEQKYNYLLDIIWKNELEKIVGDQTRWVTYQQQVLHPSTARLPRVILPPIASSNLSRVRSLEVINEWGPWGPCRSCDRPHGEKQKNAYCRIKPAPPVEDEEFSKEDELNNIEEKKRKKRQNSLKYEHIINITDPHWSAIVDLYEISCRSKMLAKYLPTVYRILTDVPDFDLVEQCPGDCEAEREEFIKKNKNKLVKFKQKFILQEGDHQIIMCPESNIDSTITWQYNKKPLEAFELKDKRQRRPMKNEKQKKEEEIDNNESHVALDAFKATLYLSRVRPEDGGNYTCFVDGIPMLEARVYVLSHHKIISSELGRHALYLGLIFLIAAKCYSAGIAITCMKRDTFIKFKEDSEEETNVPLLSIPSTPDTIFQD